MRLRATLALGLATLCMLLLAPFLGTSAAGAYPITTCSTLSVSTTNPLPGEDITVTGTNFTPNASVRLELHSTPVLLTTVVASAQGSFSTQVTLPAGLQGSHDIVATTGAVSSTSCPADPIQTLAIQAETNNNGNNGTNNGNGNGLSVTGFDIAGLLVLAAGLIGAGVLLNRRKTRVGSR